MSTQIDINKKYTRTSSSNQKELSTALCKEFTKSHIKTLEISVDSDGEWSFYRRNMIHIWSGEICRCLDGPITNKFRLGQTFYYVDDFGQSVVGVVSLEQNKFVFQGKVEDDEKFDSPSVIIIWEFSISKIVQTTSLIWSVGFTGLFVESEEVFESDRDLMYRSELRTKLRPFIQTKQPINMVSLPEIAPAQPDWCTCVYDDGNDEESEETDDVKDLDPHCVVHGVCDDCEKINSACDCFWFGEEHFCRSCGVTLSECECNHILELTEKLYDF